MGRHKLDRRDKIIQSFASTIPLKERLIKLAAKKNVTVSALIRQILEEKFENRES